MIKKGKIGGECNRTICKNIAKHFHQYNGKYYCSVCAEAIQSYENSQINPWRVFLEFYIRKYHTRKELAFTKQSALTTHNWDIFQVIIRQIL